MSRVTQSHVERRTLKGKDLGDLLNRTSLRIPQSLKYTTFLQFAYRRQQVLRFEVRTSYEMEFIRLITLFSCLILCPALTFARCHFKNYGPTNKTALATCIPRLRPHRVDGSNCGNAKWFLSEIAWSSTEDCYNLCTSCLSSGISAGASEVSCLERQLFAVCHVGYY
ncbi:hypothetical protein Pst134EA_000817 [Puccinia striiformis f. sp. tritici]|nr:hypothetical protein Pst134EA_000817 [Puccinia striiformis f. sp. tritici]KAH9473745.1 hypothetical protein Pst134EA_000817 [Puccinia striiformis f. sp. tritici]